jgi:hypothetical protein
MPLFKTYFLVLAFLPGYCIAQEKEEEFINWSPSRQLTWSDYRGKPDPNSDAAASTSTFLGIEYNIDEKGLTYKIQCRFSPARSWGRSRTDLVLSHERGHFDIAEIFARKLNKRMKEYQFNKTSYKDDLKKIYEGITSEKEAFQDLYDNETDHSRKLEKQQEWLKKISNLLDELKDYARY